MYRILIVEDDEKINNKVVEHLQKWGYSAKGIEDFSDVLKTFVSYDPHLVLLDITLPFYNGYYWCEEIRKISKIPIIFLSSAADDMNIVMAMNVGADDFIPKPFALEVLMAKIQALLRRSYDFSGTHSVIEHQGALLNMKDATLVYENDTVDLTKNEYKILLTLLENKGKVISREELMEKLWESDSFVDENTLSVNVARLRKKLDEIKLENFIVTKKGMGYIIENQ